MELFRDLIIGPISQWLVSRCSKTSFVTKLSNVGGSSFGFITFDLPVKYLLKISACCCGSFTISPFSIKGGITLLLDVFDNSQIVPPLHYL